MSRSLVVNLLVLALALIVAATIIGLVALWPSERSFAPPGALRNAHTEQAEIVSIATVACPTPTRRSCRAVGIELHSGKDEGRRFRITVFDPADTLPLSVGDEIRVSPNQLPEGAQVGGVRVDPYVFADFERRQPLLLLGLLFAGLVIVTGRWQGLRALIGLVASLAIVIGFIVPAILNGESAEGVALIGSLAVMLVTLGLAHGASIKTLAAVLGTTAALLLTLGLARLFTDAAHLTGLSSDEATFLRATVGDVSIQGLFLAGVVIATLGVLDDLTVSQASTVMALRRANRALGFRSLFTGALDVGRDHITATVNTLVLAYAGASLPVLLIFSLAGTSFSDAINSEAVAEQIVATLVGSIGLIAAVPITTALAALLVTHVQPSALADPHAGHAH